MAEAGACVTGLVGSEDHLWSLLPQSCAHPHCMWLKQNHILGGFPRPVDLGLLLSFCLVPETPSLDPIICEKWMESQSPGFSSLSCQQFAI